MSKARHTPGPWRLEWGSKSPFDAGTAMYAVITAHDGLHIATVWEINGRSPVTSDLRDGALIAAAPELLAALTELYDATTSHDPERIREARVSAIIALGKATQGD